ncbi:MAG: Gfo/Idh/MocA family oxidoreductase [Clostridia bacterium]|nr:Gfo/Idh/MocA family oxidoreductase [Clostridia bacterium]
MLKVCIISCGMIANAAHIPAYKQFPNDFEIAAVSDINAEAAENTAKRHGIKKWYTDAKKMLDECRPDVVSVCVPNCFHKEYTLMALSYGANVLCEKPLAFTKKDAEEMFAMAKKQGKVLMACQSMRFTPDRLAAKKYIEEKQENNFYYMELSRVRRRGIPFWGAFHIGKISGGGAFVDIGVHMIDAALWLVGNSEVLSVCGVKSKNHADEIGDLVSSGALTGHVDSIRKFDPDEMDVEDFSAGSVKFKNGAMLNFKVAWATNQPEEAGLKLVNKNVGINISACEIYRGMEPVEKLDGIPLEYDGHFPGHCYLVKNMRDVLKNGADPIVKPEETIACAEIIEAFYRSAELGREVFAEEL